MLYWGADWTWGLPLLVLMVVAHVCGIALIAMLARHQVTRPRKVARFVTFVALTALATAALIALEAASWAALYVWLGALPDQRAAMLYSLGALTSYDHVAIFLEDRWSLLGSIEAVNGLILFGLTTAFLLAVIQQVWPLPRD